MKRRPPPPRTNATIAFDRCYKKKLYWTRADAQEALTRLWAAVGAHDLEIYPCEIGQSEIHYHIGSQIPAGARTSLSRLRTIGRDTVWTSA